MLHPSGAIEIMHIPHRLQNRLVALGLSSLTVVVPGMMPSAQAVEFPDTGDRGAPTRTAGGGTRGELCESNEWSEWDAIALVPNNNVSTFSGQQASLWLHLSENFYDKTAEIYIQDLANNNTVYEQQVEISSLYQETHTQNDQNNLVKVDLPEFSDSGAPLLEAGKAYYWDFSIICNPNDRAQDYVVRGIFQRVEADANLMEIIATASPVQQLENYANAGLWQETLQTAVLLKEEKPDLWNKLLSSVGLDMLAVETTLSNQANATEVNTGEVNTSQVNVSTVKVPSLESIAIDSYR